MLGRTGTWEPRVLTLADRRVLIWDVYRHYNETNTISWIFRHYVHHKSRIGGRASLSTGRSGAGAGRRCRRWIRTWIPGASHGEAAMSLGRSTSSAVAMASTRQGRGATDAQGLGPYTSTCGFSGGASLGLRSFRRNWVDRSEADTCVSQGRKGWHSGALRGQRQRPPRYLSW